MTIISIDAVSASRHVHDGKARLVFKSELLALTAACAELIEELGALSDKLEVLKVSPWHVHRNSNNFDIKAAFATHAHEPVKLEIKCTFKRPRAPNDYYRDARWNSKLLRETVVNMMKRAIVDAVTSRMYKLDETREDWEKLLSKIEKT